MEAEYILGFLDNLDKNRKNQPKTINNRLAAIHSFLHFLSFEIPEYSAPVQRCQMIPFRKEEKRQIDFLTKLDYTPVFAFFSSPTYLTLTFKKSLRFTLSDVSQKLLYRAWAITHQLFRV